MTRPLVYLDTNDYINGYYHPNSVTRQAIDYIVELREKDKIQIGYSGFNVIEFITKPSNESYREERKARGAFIKRVCGHNAFPYITDLERGASFPNDGIWMPLQAMEPFRSKNITKLLRKSLNAELKRLGIFRKQRRSFGNPIEVVRKIIRENPSWGRSVNDFGDLPIPRSVIEDGTILRIFLGEVTGRSAEKSLTACLSDPEIFSEIYYTSESIQNVVDEYFRKIII